jgi:hypothetical protein
MTFATIEEAKLHACRVTDGELTPERAQQRLIYLRGQLARAPAEYASVWQRGGSANTGTPISGKGLL